MSLKYEPASEPLHINGGQEGGLAWTAATTLSCTTFCASLLSLLAICSRVQRSGVRERCSGSETGSYLRLVDFVYHSTLGLRVSCTTFCASLLSLLAICFRV